MKKPLRIPRLILMTACLLAAFSLFMLTACEQVQKPEVKGEGLLSVKMARGLVAPEFHAPLERWRTTHKQALDKGDFTQRECVLCHDPRNSCNQCHRYVAAPAIDVSEASLLWPDSPPGEKDNGRKEVR
jgi:hypothetical protein